MPLAFLRQFGEASRLWSRFGHGFEARREKAMEGEGGRGVMITLVVLYRVALQSRC